jgi:hypothetical protein
VPLAALFALADVSEAKEVTGDADAEARGQGARARPEAFFRVTM